MIHVRRTTFQDETNATKYKEVVKYFTNKTLLFVWEHFPIKVCIDHDHSFGNTRADTDIFFLSRNWGVIGAHVGWHVQSIYMLRGFAFIVDMLMI